jgi:hypothetical protein
MLVKDDIVPVINQDLPPYHEYISLHLVKHHIMKMWGTEV